MGIPKALREVDKLVDNNKVKYVKYQDGAKMYSMGLASFQKIAKEAKAVRKVKGYCLVNTKLVEEYIESTYGEGENDDGKYEK